MMHKITFKLRERTSALSQAQLDEIAQALDKVREIIDEREIISDSDIDTISEACAAIENVVVEHYER